MPDTCWLVASGGDQAELHDVFEKRGISHLFNGGIFGSPDTKEQILLREKELGKSNFLLYFWAIAAMTILLPLKLNLTLFLFLAGLK